MKSITLLCTVLFFGLQLQAQETIRLSREEAEAMFLQNNLQLMSEQLNIESQQAEVIQAKVWPNPQFTISEINLWATDRQTGGEIVSPPLWNSFGKNQQFSFELQQLVQTAGKRKKRIALEQLDVSKAEQYFEELLRGLKLELRQQLTELQYLQQTIKVHQNLIDNISILTNAYKNQVEQGNTAKAEYTRLKAQELEINKNMLELTRQSDEVQKELRMLLRIDPTFSITINDDELVKDVMLYEALVIDQIMDKAKENRPDYKLALLEGEYASRLLSYEKSKRVPDMTFGMSYDRNGSTMLDFVGVGLSFDLPLFDRHKGDIKKAQINIENARIRQESTLIAVENEIILAYKSLQQALRFMEKIEPDYEDDLDLLLANYTKSFSSKNLSMLEYFDFIDAYLENKKIILEAQKDFSHKVEELNYVIGADL